MKLLRILFTALLMMISLAGFAQANKQTDAEKQAEYQKRVRQALQLDYSMPDYTTSKIDAKLIGPRLAAILNKIMDSRGQQTTIATLSVIQTSQVDGLNYGRIKDLKLDKVTKQGNDLTISFQTILDSNNLNLKKSKLFFRFKDGVSEDIVTNDFFLSICRYIE